MLGNPFYYGEMRVKGKLYPHIYEPLISKQLFDKCRRISTARHGITQTKSHKQFLLSGLVRCSHCGHLYSVYLAKGQYPFLQPPTTRTPSCVHYNIPERLIWEALDEQLSELHLGKHKLKYVLDLIGQKKREELKNRDSLSLELQVQEKTVRNKKSKLLDLFLDGGIPKSEYDDTNKKLDSELLDIDARKQDLQADIRGFYDNLSKCLKIADFSHFLIKSSRFSQKRQLLKLLTSNFFVDGKNVVISIRKPFDKMVLSKGCLTWLGQLDSNQRHTD